MTFQSSERQQNINGCYHAILPAPGCELSIQDHATAALREDQQVKKNRDKL